MTDEKLGIDPMAGIDGEACKYWGDANADEARWLAAKWDLMSASWAGALMGTDTYHQRDADEAGMEERPYLIHKFRQREGLTPNNAMRQGSYMEPVVIDQWSKITGVPMVRSNAMYVSKRFDRMSCTIDGFITPDPEFQETPDLGFLEGSRDEDERAEQQAWFWPFLDRLYALGEEHGPGLIEVKWKRVWAGGNKSQAAKYPERFFATGPDAHSETFGCPTQHAWQVMHQMAVTGVKWAVLATIIGGFDPRAWIIEANDIAIGRLGAECAAFWKAFDHGANNDLHPG